MTEIVTIDWFGRWGTSVFSENTAIFDINVSLRPVRNGKRRCSTIFKIKKNVPQIDPVNPLYHRLILSIYTSYVSGKLGQGVGGGTMFSKPKMCGKNPVWKNILQGP